MSTEYTSELLRKDQSSSEYDKSLGYLHYVYGSDGGKAGNLDYIDERTIIYTLGNSVVLEDIISNSKRYIMGIDEGGVGCVGVHPSKKLFAVGGRGHKPNICIYSYPELKIVKVMKNEAERGYASLNFNQSGTRLASVAMAPDYLLTIWEWELEKVALHTKAFGQDVFSVRFSHDDEGRLTTSGTGHIRFWKIASTFTGLKLQGQIGKFGKVELSDISAFIELPDGKVVSGTESGALLLWEAGFIKCRLVMNGGILPHEGDVTYCELDRKENCVITGSLDGYIRYWDLADIDVAEVDADVTLDYEIKPIAEIYLGKGKGVRTLIDSGCSFSHSTHAIADGTISADTPIITPEGGRTLVIMDANGDTRLIKCNIDKESTLIKHLNAVEGDVDKLDTSTLQSFHAGPINAVDTCPISHIAITGGNDCRVRIWDYINRSLVCGREFDSPVSVVKWIPQYLDASGKLVIAGFNNGLMRVMSLGSDNIGASSLGVTSVLKPHNARITSLAFTDNGRYLATASEDGFIWIFDSKNLSKGKIDPLRYFIPKPGAEGSDKVFAAYCINVQWTEDSKSVLCTCSDGILRIADINEILSGGLEFDHIETYRIDVPLIEKKLETTLAIPIAVAPSSPNKKATTEEGVVDGVEGESTEETPEADITPEIEYKYETVDVKVTYAMPLRAGSKQGGILVAGNCDSSLKLLQVDSGVNDAKELLTGLNSEDGKAYLKSSQTTNINYSWSHKVVATGGADGSVVVRLTKYIQPFLRFTAHSARTSGLAVSFDDHFIISCSEDGTMNIQYIDTEKMKTEGEKLEADLDAGVYTNVPVKVRQKDDYVEPESMKVVTDSSKPTCLASADGKSFATMVTAPTDVPEVDPTSYSIEDEKVKAAEDERMLTADQRKERVRIKIKNLQKEFAAIRAQNDQLPSAAKLNENDLLVDPVIKTLLDDQGEAMVTEVHNVCAYESERASRLLEKLQERLMNGLLVEEMSLSSLPQQQQSASQSPRAVTTVKSIRTKAMDQTLATTLESVRDALKKEAAAIARSNAALLAKEAAEKDIEAMQGKIAKKLNNKGDGGDGGEDGNEGKFSAQARRDARAKRKQTISAHMLKKPREDEDDPRDVKAISDAKETIGDFKLKGASDYTVPAHQRVNAEKKRRQLVMLEESTITLRLQYNERFLALRHLKRKMIDIVKNDMKRVKEINHLIGEDDGNDSLWDPSIDPSEFPDDRDEVDKMELDAFTKTREKVPWIKAVAIANSRTTGNKTQITVDMNTGAYKIIKSGVQITNVDDIEPSDNDSKASEDTENIVPTTLEGYQVDTRIFSTFYGTKPESDSILSSLEMKVPALRAAKRALFERPLAKALTAETVKAQSLLRSRLIFEKQELLKKTSENVEVFASAIEELRLSRHVTIGRLLLAELRMIVLLQEFQLLHTFEDKDNALHQKQVRCMREKNELVSQANETESRFTSKKAALTEFQEKSAAVSSEYETLVPPTDPFVEILTKIFKRKIKKRKMTDDGEEEEEESDEEEDDDDEDEDDDDFEEFCPPGCDSALYDKVLELRERRLDFDELSADTQKEIDDCKKTSDRLRTRKIQIEKDMLQTEKEIQQFQLTKQAALNQVEVVIPLRSSQIFSFDSSGALSGPAKKVSNTNTGNDDGPSEEELAEQEQIRQLADSSSRSLVAETTISSHVIMKNDDLSRLQARIGELEIEVSSARRDFKALHKERLRLEKDVKTGKSSLEEWSRKCTDLQMLKFGKLIDLDELEAGSDTTKLVEAESNVKAIETEYLNSSVKLKQAKDRLQDKLSAITLDNTKLLKEISDLTGRKIDLNQILNNPGEIVSGDKKLAMAKEIEEKKNIQNYIKMQAREIESLKGELAMLRRKDNLSAQQLPIPPSGSIINQSSTQGGALPPIPSKSQSLSK